jgi:hypothetical protein
MYGNAVGFNPRQNVLAGLPTKGDAGAFAKGQAMAGAAGMRLDNQTANQELGTKQMSIDSTLRQKGNENSASKALHGLDQRVKQGALASQKNVFNTGMNFGYAQLRKNQQTRLQEALLGGLMRDEY